MGSFDFQSSSGYRVDPATWVETWSSKFDNRKYPEDCYEELVANGLKLSDVDFDILGAWKDGGIRRTAAGTGRRFGNCWVSFTGTWSETAASCAYGVWKSLPVHRPILDRPRNRR